MKQDNLPEIIQGYIKDVLENTNRHGKLEVLSIKRFLKDLKNHKWEYRQHHYDKCVEFFECVNLPDKPSIMAKVLPFQAFYLYNILSVFVKGTSERRFHYSYYQIARKNNKTGFQAQLQIYMATLDNPEDLDIIPPLRQILVCANSQDQGKDLFKSARGFSEKYDPKSKILTPLTTEIKLKNGTMIKVLNTSPKSGDGYLAYWATLDEYHCAENSGMFDVIASSTSSSLNYHICVITTAGFDLNGPCYEYRNNCVDILNGTIKDDSLFIQIFEMDEGDDWKEPNNWVKSNPSMGTIIYQSALEIKCNKVINTPSKLNEFKTKSLNIWCESAITWISAEYWNKNAKPGLDIKDFKEQKCYVGIDLSTTEDFTSLSYVFQNDYDNPLEGITTFTYTFIPEDTLAKRKQFVKNWVDQGHIIVTKGNVIDYDVIVDKIEELSALGICPECILIDPHNATSTVLRLENLGYEVVMHGQSLMAFDKATVITERMALQGRITHNDNPCMNWMISNVMIKSDNKGNVKPDKAKSADKIDGVIAMIQAIGGAIHDYEECVGSLEIDYIDNN